MATPQKEPLRALTVAEQARWSGWRRRAASGWIGCGGRPRCWRWARARLRRGRAAAGLRSGTTVAASGRAVQSAGLAALSDRGRARS